MGFERGRTSEASPDVVHNPFSGALNKGSKLLSDPLPDSLTFLPSLLPRASLFVEGAEGGSSRRQSPE